jgi:general secretion pathway protein N
MRIRLPLGRSLFFLSAFLFCLVALLPLRLALAWLGFDARGFAVREAVGNIWVGGMREAELGPVPIGDVSARLRTLPLLVGRARIDLRRPGEEGGLKAGLTGSRHGFGLDDAEASLDTGAAFAPLPIQGLDLSGVTAHFENGVCATARGLVTARVAGSLAGLALPTSFSGEARCEGGALLLPLVSATRQERLQLELFDDGRYRIELLLAPADQTMRDRLGAAGFAASGGNYVLAAQGRF